uniref:ATP synthase F0 subunit 8 n=1 Tax=Cilnia humeralis TaxID=627798 RepID=UPI0022FD6182|nr:ATP synthase F0 subunit 8 [Cilnia humeralis]UIX55329.1 ATP synthase F0 subunit 8 [Cilnia humeralis]
MPQMMPLNWLMLFSFFSILLILFNIINYYSPYNKISLKMSKKLTYKTMNWKW